MIDLFPFSGYPVAVLGLGPEGVATARALSRSGAEVWAWDDDEAKRAAAAAAEVPLRDLNGLDWREPVSFVIEHTIPHGPAGAHPLIGAAKAANCEVIADTELLARAQRDAGYVAIVSRTRATEALDLFGHVFQISGRETEVGGDAGRPPLGLYPLEFGSIYVFDMPPARAELTLSITFDAAVFLDLGNGAWPPCETREETIAASRWVFHRQTGPQGAIVNVDDATGRRIHDDLVAKRDQVVIPISGKSRAPNGVYVAGGILYDDLGGRAEAITDLPLPSDEIKDVDPVLAAAVYAAAVVLDIPKHAAMASLRSFYMR
jgi:UDP-N-acetylmuramoylalanine--D-glutamate ligase